MLILIKFLTGYIPQGIAFVLAVHAVCKTKVKRKPFLISSLLMIFIIFLIRSLPLQTGVTTLFNILALIVVSYVVNQLPINKAVIGGLIITIFMFCLELISILLVSVILHIDPAKMNESDSFKTYLAIPSSIIFTAVVIPFYYARTRNLKQGK